MSSPSPVEATPDGQPRTALGSAVTALLALQEADAAEVAGRLHDGIAQSLTGLLLVADGLIGPDPGTAEGGGLALITEGLRAAREELAEVGRHLLRPTRHPTRPDLAIRTDLAVGRHPVPSTAPDATDVTASGAATTLARMVVHHALLALAGTVRVVSVRADGQDRLVVVVAVADATADRDDRRLPALADLVHGCGGQLTVRRDEAAVEVVATLPADLHMPGTGGGDGG